MTTPAQLARLEAKLGELVASRQRVAKDRRTFTQYADDPVGFLRDVLKCRPWKQQRRIARLVRDNPLVAVRSCNSAGKDWLAARLALWWVYAVSGRVLLTGPTARQVDEILMRKEIGRAWRVGRLPGDLLTHALRRTPGGEADILAMTSTEVGKLTGFHGARVMVILSEAQDVEDFAFEAAMANAVGEHDRILAVGNPLRPLGRFYVINRPGSQWRTVKISAFDHPNVIKGRDVIPGAVTRKWVEQQRKEWGAASPIYIARVDGEFPENAEDALVTRAWLEAAADRHERGTFSDEARGSSWTAGVDVARFGSDHSALALVRGPVLRSVRTWHGTDTMGTANKVMAKLRAKHLAPREDARNPLCVPPAGMVQYGPGITSRDCMIIVDVTGIGAGVMDKLAEQGWNAVEHASSGSPRDTERFINRRAEVYWNMRVMLEEGTIALPRDELLFEELLHTRYLIGPNGKVAIEAKKEIRTRLGRSPDRADAVAMAFGATDETSGGGDLIDL